MEEIIAVNETKKKVRVVGDVYKEERQAFKVKAMRGGMGVSAAIRQLVLKFLREE